MSNFIQLHYLTVYPPSNPNRDDLGRPKSASFGGSPRLRISSQALKRAARTSNVMQEALEGKLGSRTQRIGEVVEEALSGSGSNEEATRDAATKVAEIFGKLDVGEAKKGNIRIRQLAFISPDETALAVDLAKNIVAGEDVPDSKALKKLVLRAADGAADIAMFGRMLAHDPDFNREAAVQVSHAITTHQALVEDDFYTAVDDLKKPSEDAGAGFVGNAGFGSGVYYFYACIDTDLLVENLAGDRALAARATEALTEALATATPSGKRNSFAHQTRAGFIRAESGCQQPRSLAGAFFQPVTGDLMGDSINALQDMATSLDASYGACSDDHKIMNVGSQEGSLAEIRAFVKKAVLHD